MHMIDYDVHESESNGLVLGTSGRPWLVAELEEDMIESTHSLLNKDNTAQ